MVAEVKHEFLLLNNSEQGIFGKESTPFLLKRVNELTGGNSLKSSKNYVPMLQRS